MIVASVKDVQVNQQEFEESPGEKVKDQSENKVFKSGVVLPGVTALSLRRTERVLSLQCEV